MLKTKVFEDYKQAMKDKESIKKGVLSILKANLDSAEKDKKAPLTELEEIAVVNRELKQINQSLESAKEANRQDLVNLEEYKIKVVAIYLPNQLDKDAIIPILVQAGVTSGVNMGEAMKIAKAKLEGKAPNKLISEVVRELIK